MKSYTVKRFAASSSDSENTDTNKKRPSAFPAGCATARSTSGPPARSATPCSSAPAGSACRRRPRQRWPRPPPARFSAGRSAVDQRRDGDAALHVEGPAQQRRADHRCQQPALLLGGCSRCRRTAAPPAALASISARAAFASPAALASAPSGAPCRPGCASSARRWHGVDVAEGVQLRRAPADLDEDQQGQRDQRRPVLSQRLAQARHFVLREPAQILPRGLEVHLHEDAEEVHAGQRDRHR